MAPKFDHTRLQHVSLHLMRKVSGMSSEGSPLEPDDSACTAFSKSISVIAEAQPDILCQRKLNEWHAPQAWECGEEHFWLIGVLRLSSKAVAIQSDKKSSLIKPATDWALHLFHSGAELECS